MTQKKEKSQILREHLTLHFNIPALDTEGRTPLDIYASRLADEYMIAARTEGWKFALAKAMLVVQHNSTNKKGKKLTKFQLMNRDIAQEVVEFDKMSVANG